MVGRRLKSAPATSQEWIQGIECRGIPIHHELPMPLICAGLRKHLNPSVTQLVILRREGILVDSYFADRRFRRQLPGGKPVDVKLPAIWTRGRSRQGFE